MRNKINRFNLVLKIEISLNGYLRTGFGSFYRLFSCKNLDCHIIKMPQGGRVAILLNVLCSERFEVIFEFTQHIMEEGYMPVLSI